MSERIDSKKVYLLVSIVSLSLFWAILFLKIPVSFSHFFHNYSFVLFLIVLFVYFLSLQRSHRYRLPVLLGGTMVLFALPLSYLWSSGFSDNFLIGGLLPYKDAKNYYYGANLILNGLPPIDAGQSTERPLFPGFLSFVFLLTGQNLKVAIAIIVQVAGIGFALSALQVHRLLGASVASVFAAFLYFFIQPWIGYSMSEVLGFTLGCIGFTLFLFASRKPRWLDLLLGIFVLLIAISARAGPFFIFPLIAIWAGWSFRSERGFSLPTILIILIVVICGYLLVNSLYPRLLGIPPESSFGNFSYALYGQVRGGTGWHRAIEDLGTRNPSIVYRAAWEYFLKHPISLFIGFAKAYRDFFLIGDRSIFPFGELGWHNWLNVVSWVMTLALVVLGLIQSVKEVSNNLLSLLVAGFVGIFLSIPFLPPIDGGARFYAGAIPFFIILPALGINWFSKSVQSVQTSDYDVQVCLTVTRYASVIMIIFTLIIPPALVFVFQKPATSLPVCPVGQEPFVTVYHSGSHIDFVKDGSASCGFVPEICQDDFESNNAEKSTDDFYQFLFQSIQEDGSKIRLIPAINFADDKFHYFYLVHDKFPDGLPFGVISGCAIEILTKNQTIYQVESLSHQENNR